MRMLTDLFTLSSCTRNTTVCTRGVTCQRQNGSSLWRIASDLARDEEMGWSCSETRDNPVHQPLQTAEGSQQRLAQMGRRGKHDFQLSLHELNICSKFHHARHVTDFVLHFHPLWLYVFIVWYIVNWLLCHFVLVKKKSCHFFKWQAVVKLTWAIIIICWSNSCWLHLWIVWMNCQLETGLCVWNWRAMKNSSYPSLVLTEHQLIDDPSLDAPTLSVLFCIRSQLLRNA